MMPPSANVCWARFPASLKNQSSFNSQQGASFMTTLIVKASNISCSHCVHTIQNEVGELPGVKSVQAKEDSKLVTVTFEAPATTEQIEALMTEIGYPAEAVSQ